MESKESAFTYAVEDLARPFTSAAAIEELRDKKGISDEELEREAKLDHPFSKYSFELITSLICSERLEILNDDEKRLVLYLGAEKELMKKRETLIRHRLKIEPITNPKTLKSLLVSIIDLERLEGNILDQHPPRPMGRKK